MHQLVGDLPDTPVKCALLLGTGKPQLPVSGSTDDVHHRLRLCQGHLAGEKRTLGEFARLGSRCAGVEDCLKNPACDVDAAVAGKFHGVLAGVAVGGTEYGGNAVVQRGVVRVEEAAVGAGVARHGGQRFSGDAAEARLRKGDGVAAGDADDGDSAGGVGCGNGGFGVCVRKVRV